VYVCVYLYRPRAKVKGMQLGTAKKTEDFFAALRRVCICMCVYVCVYVHVYVYVCVCNVYVYVYAGRAITYI